MSIMDNVQPAVKKETGNVAAITGIGLILILGCFFDWLWEDVWQSLISFLWDLQCRKQLQQQMRTQRE